MGDIYENKIGIAVFGYNRPKELERTLSKLSIFVEHSVFIKRVIVFIDGPKNQNDKKKLRDCMWSAVYRRPFWA